MINLCQYAAFSSVYGKPQTGTVEKHLGFWNGSVPRLSWGETFLIGKAEVPEDRVANELMEESPVPWNWYSSSLLQGKHQYSWTGVVDVRSVFAHTNWSLGRVRGDEGQGRVERLRVMDRSGTVRTQHGGVVGWIGDYGKENQLCMGLPWWCSG